MSRTPNWVNAGTRFAKRVLGTTIPQVTKRALTVTGLGALAAGAASVLVPGVLPVAIAAKGLELLVSGISIIATTTAMTTPTEAAVAAVSPSTAQSPYDHPQLEIERLRDAWRRHALDAAVALIAYIAIAIPVGFLVLQISAELPVSAIVIVACYSYIGLTKFLGFNEFSVTFQDVQAAISKLTGLQQANVGTLPSALTPPAEPTGAA